MLQEHIRIFKLREFHRCRNGRQGSQCRPRSSCLVAKQSNMTAHNHPKETELTVLIIAPQNREMIFPLCARDHMLNIKFYRFDTF